MNRINTRLLEVIVEEVGMCFDADQTNLSDIAKRMGWRSPNQVARALENLRRAGAIRGAERKLSSAPKRWVVVEKLEAVA